MRNGLNIKIFQSCVFEKRSGCLVLKREEFTLIKLTLKLVCTRLITKMTRVTIILNVNLKIVKSTLLQEL